MRLNDFTSRELQLLTFFPSVLFSRPSWGFPCGSAVENPLPVQRSWVRSLGQEDLLAEGMTTYSSILAWKIPGTEAPARLHLRIEKSQIRLSDKATQYWTTNTKVKVRERIWPDENNIGSSGWEQLLFPLVCPLWVYREAGRNWEVISGGDTVCVVAFPSQVLHQSQKYHSSLELSLIPPMTLRMCIYHKILNCHHYFSNKIKL